MGPECLLFLCLNKFCWAAKVAPHSSHMHALSVVPTWLVTCSFSSDSVSNSWSQPSKLQQNLLVVYFFCTSSFSKWLACLCRQRWPWKNNNVTDGVNNNNNKVYFSFLAFRKILVLHVRHAFWCTFFWRSLPNEDEKFSYLKFWRQRQHAAINCSFFASTRLVFVQGKRKHTPPILSNATNMWKSQHTWPNAKFFFKVAFSL